LHITSGVSWEDLGRGVGRLPEGIKKGLFKINLTRKLCTNIFWGGDGSKVNRIKVADRVDSQGFAEMTPLRIPKMWIIGRPTRKIGLCESHQVKIISLSRFSRYTFYYLTQHSLSNRF